MARGKKYSDEIKEQAFLLYATCGSYAETARQLGLAKSTVKGWVDKKEPDALEQARTEKKMEFVDKASEIIDKGLRLLDRRINTALEHEDELDKLIDEIFTSDKEEISQEEKKMLASKIRAMQLQKMGDITTAIGTLYDKRALAKGETTQNESINVNIKIV